MPGPAGVAGLIGATLAAKSYWVPRPAAGAPHGALDLHASMTWPTGEAAGRTPEDCCQTSSACSCGFAGPLAAMVCSIGAAGHALATEVSGTCTTSRTRFSSRVSCKRGTFGSAWGARCSPKRPLTNSPAFANVLYQSWLACFFVVRWPKPTRALHIWQCQAALRSSYRNMPKPWPGGFRYGVFGSLSQRCYPPRRPGHRNA